MRQAWSEAEREGGWCGWSPVKGGGSYRALKATLRTLAFFQSEVGALEGSEQNDVV